MISRSLERPDRTASRASDATNRYKIRYTRTQHRLASLQVNAHDRVFGTHRVFAHVDGLHRPASRQVNDHDRVSGTHRVVKVQEPLPLADTAI